MKSIILGSVAKFTGILLLSFVPIAQVIAVDLDPKVVGAYSVPNPRAFGVALSGKYACVTGDLFIPPATSRFHLSIIDISNPARPLRVGSYNTDTSMTWPAAAGEVVFVLEWSNYKSHVAAFNITDPANPRRIGGYSADDYISGIAISGDYLCVTGAERRGAGPDTGYLEILSISDAANLRRVGRYDSSSPPITVLVQEQMAYILSYGTNVLGDLLGDLQIIDIKDPSRPQMRGRCSTGSGEFGVGGLTVTEGYAYIVQTGRLRVFDVRNSANPRPAGEYRIEESPYLRGSPGSPTVSGKYLFVLDSDGYLRIWELKDPARPVLLPNRHKTGGQLTVSGSYLYVAAEGSGLEIFDLSDLPRLHWTGSYDPGGEAMSIVVSGDRACVANGTAGLQLIDIGDRSKPRELGGYNTPGFAQDVALSGHHAYIADSESGLCIVDISNPATLQQVNLPADPADPDTIRNASGVALFGNYVCVADQEAGLRVIDVTNPRKPQQVGFYPSNLSPSDVALSGNIACLGELANSAGRLQVLDLSDPRRPRLLSQVPFQTGVRWVTIHGSHAYVSGWHGGLKVIDLSNPANPRVLETGLDMWPQVVPAAPIYAAATPYLLDLGNPSAPRSILRLGAYEINDLEVSGNHVFLASGWQGLQVVDFHNIANPQRASSYKTTNSIQTTAFSGKYAYLGEHHRFSVLDLSNPDIPERVGSLDKPVRSVTPYGDFVFLFEGAIDSWLAGPLHVVNASDPRNPVLIRSYYDLSPRLERITASGDYLYLLEQVCLFICGGQSRLRIFDARNPADLLEVWSGHFASVGAFEISGGYAYVTDNGDRSVSDDGDGVLVFDLSNPASIQRVASYKTDGEISGVAIAGGYAYVTDWNQVARLQVLDITNPATPRHVASCQIGGNPPSGLQPAGMAISGDYLYVSLEAEGLVVVEITNPASPKVVGRNPNLYSASLSVANGRVFGLQDGDLIVLHEYHPMRFGQFALGEAGAARLRISGPPGVPGRLQRSRDLRNWNDWRPVNFTQNTLELVDPDAVFQSRGFYRVVVP